jgi:hypothetical protein
MSIEEEEEADEDEEERRGGRRKEGTKRVCENAYFLSFPLLLQLVLPTIFTMLPNTNLMLLKR